MVATTSATIGESTTGHTSSPRMQVHRLLQLQHRLGSRAHRVRRLLAGCARPTNARTTTTPHPKLVTVVEAISATTSCLSRVTEADP
jgi:hypothetical protein